MVHRIEDIKVLPNFIIEARFFGGEIKQYDVTNLFDQFPQFCIFKSNPSLFERVQVDVGGYGISWNDELDLDADVIWDNGVLMEVYKDTNINRLIAYQFTLARQRANFTQKQLAEKTGIHQAEISKIERGIGNPSIQTLQRLADGLGIELVVTLNMTEGHSL